MDKPKQAILVEFGSLIRKKREELGISQEELADKAALHRTYIGDIERGERNVSLINIKKIANALGIPLSILLNGFDELTSETD